MKCENCNAQLPSLATRRKRVNEAFYQLGRFYHNGLPTTEVVAILERNGFEFEEGIYCGSDGAVKEEIGDQTWLSFSWHKMPSGRYEVVAYVN